MNAEPATPTSRIGDIVITVVLLAVFAGAFVLAQQWPFRARLFPTMLSAAGIALAVLKLVGFAVRSRRGVPATVPSAHVVDGLIGEEDEDHGLEYVFASAGGAAWAAALGWIAAFFLGLWLVGVFIAVPLFALAYLRVAGRAGWLGAGLYASAAGAVLWLAFRQLLSVPMPTGVL